MRGLFEKNPGSGIWWIRFVDAQGKLHRKKAGRKSDAVTLLSKRRTEKLQQTKLPEKYSAKSILFSELLDDALEHSSAENGQRSTHELSLKFARMCGDWANRAGDAITKQEIVRWLQREKAKRSWSEATLNRWHAAFSLIFRVGIDNDKIAFNPASRIRRKSENNQRIRFLSPLEESKLISVLNTRFSSYLPAFIISLHTGMRASEQWRLRWADIDFERRILTVRKQKHRQGERHIPLNSVALEVLFRLRKRNRDKNIIFFNSDGGQMRAHRDWFDPAVKEAGIEDYTWHCNRHTFASRLAMAGENLATIATLMGHRTIGMTMRYAHLSPAHNQSAVEHLVAFSKRKTTDTRTDTDPQNQNLPL
jgi:integrase